MLRKKYGHTGAEVRGGYSILHNELQHDSDVSPNIIQVDKSRIMRWAKHVARMEEKRN